MPKLGLTTSLGSSGLTTPGIVTDSLVMKHMYPAGAVQPLSDGAAYFDASNTDWIDVGDTATLRTANFTNSAWVYFNSGIMGTGAGIITSNPASGTKKGFALIKHSDDTIRARIGDGSNFDETISPNDVVANTWTHVAQTYDGTTQKLYVDGALVDSDAYGTYVVSDNDFLIGAYYSSGALPMDGYICNVGYWSAALTQAEIKSIMWKQYADLTTSQKTNLVSWWNLDSASIANQYETNVTIDSVNSLGSELIKPTLALTDFSAYGNNTIEFDSSNDNALKVTYVDNDDGVLFRFRGDAGGANATLTSNLTTGNFYKFTFQAKSNITDTNTYFRTSSGTNYKVHLIDNTDWEEYVIYLKAASTSGDFMRIINLSSAEILWMKDFSIKQISGNHGTLT